MNPAHAAILRCPACGGAFRAEGSLRAEGRLLCGGCGRAFPVVRGIPRLLSVWEDRPVAHEVRDTRDAYDELYARFGDAMARSTDSRARLARATGQDPAVLRGLRVLDAGCGPGRDSRVMAEAGAEVVALDFSVGVETAAQALSAFPDASVVQGDLGAIPFAEGVFDRVHSVGVLHHTADPGGNAARLARLVRPGGSMVLAVYSPVPWIGPVYAALRAVTTRLPPALLYRLTKIAVPLAWVPGLRFLCCPWMSPALPPVVRHLDTFDWYRPALQSYHPAPEVRGWLEGSGVFATVALVSPAFGTFRAERAPA